MRYKTASFSRRVLVMGVIAAGVGLGGLLAGSLVAQTAGNLDATFSLDNVLGDRVTSVSPQSDGNVVIGGTISQIGGSARTLVARVHGDGSLDGSFVPPVLESYNTRTDATITTTNPTFVPAVFATAVQPDGKILVGGSFYFVNGNAGYGGLIRLNPDGSPDNGFSAPRFSGTVFALAVLASGDILVGGDYSYVDNRHRNCMVRLKPNGRLDKAYKPGTFSGTVPGADAVSAFPTVAAIAVRTDGKAWVGGIFTSIGGTARRGVARLNTDGTLDGGFTPDASFNAPSPSQGADVAVDQVFALAAQPDGKVLVGGDFRDPGTGAAANSIVRLNGDGSVDSAFNPGGSGTLDLGTGLANPPSPVVNAIVLDGDGRSLLGGSFVAYNGATANLLARLAPDGTLDPGFAVGTGPSSTVFSLALQPDGKLLAGGTFNTVDSVARPMVARFNTAAGLPPGVVVSVIASTKKAYEQGHQKGVFTVTRSGGNPETDLLVQYTIAGTAESGVDYKPLKDRVTIPAGSSSAIVKVRPIDDGLIEGNEKVVLTLSATAAYGLPAKDHASVVIVDHQ